MPVTFPALKSELQNDPTGLGLPAAVATGVYQSAADLLNAPRAGITVRRPTISPDDLLEVVDERDFVASPTAAQLAHYQALMARTRIQLTDGAGADTRTVGVLRRLFLNPGTQGTRARLTDVVNLNPASRAEQLFGGGTTVTMNDVDRALNGTG